MPGKSSTCFGKMSGEPLTEYDTEEEARRGAEHVRWKFGRDLVPYQCLDCNRWHLAPTERQTPCTTSHSCTDRNGRPKQVYDSEQAAERRADILWREREVSLRAYRCDRCSGWHLTKSHV